MITGIIKANKKSRKAKGKVQENGATSLQQFERKGTRKMIQKFYIPVKQQLNILLLKEPNNIMYQSLLQNSKIYPLTSKQLQCIIRDFDKKVRFSQFKY